MVEGAEKGGAGDGGRRWWGWLRRWWGRGFYAYSSSEKSGEGGGIGDSMGGAGEWR